MGKYTTVGASGYVVFCFYDFTRFLCFPAIPDQTIEVGSDFRSIFTPNLISRSGSAQSRRQVPSLGETYVQWQPVFFRLKLFSLISFLFPVLDAMFFTLLDFSTLSIG